ncbi:MAG: transporter substrate-binding domain-containing protein [Oscillospiraceae bacterium]|jgi:polar amino acid transport system substrate-binding protein|nr:transporter substrate-binding domain-containing protein [Oscillospiraceae bacterium]
MRKTLSLAVGLLIIASLVLAAGTALAAGTLTMGTNAEFPPFEYVEGDDVVGVDVEIAAEIAKDLGLDLVIENMAFDSVIPALVSGQIDIGVAAMTVKPERLNSVDFSNTYYNARQACIVRKDGKVADEETLAGAAIGVQNGTTGDYAAEEYSQTIERYAKALDAVLELAGGKLDAVIVDAPVAQNILDALGNDDLILLDNIAFEDEFYAVAVPKGKPDLVESINKTIDRITQDGTLDAILLKYFPATEGEE